MKITSVHFRHITHFADLKLELNYHDLPITLILADQSAGKTSLLRFSYQALTWFAARYKDLRTAGLVMQDQDILFNRLQAKIDICVEIPAEIGSLAESSNMQLESTHHCDWQLYKTLNSSGVGVSKAETAKLEKMVQLYQHAIKHDPMQGLPLIAYYPAERFVNEVNLLNKNNPLILQPGHAYEIAAIPFTTFTRFFEWLREISDIENAKSAQLLHKLYQQQQSELPQALNQSLLHAYTQMHAPSLQALKDALQIVLPEIEDIYLQYLPKLQLMVRCQGKELLYQQLSNSQRNWIALVGDIVRRLCLLNPNSLYPCREGDGILLIDQIDHQLDQQQAAQILTRLHQAFPRLQIIATGNRSELLEQAERFQCLKLEHQQLHLIAWQSLQPQFAEIYADVLETTHTAEEVSLQEQNLTQLGTAEIWQQIQHHLTAEQKQELLQRLQQLDREPAPDQLPES